MNQPTFDLHLLLPELIMAVTILVVLVVDVFLSDKHKHVAMPLSFIGVVASLAAVLSLWGTNASTIGGAFVVNGFSLLFQAFFLIVAIVVLMISYRYMRDGDYYQGEYYFLLLTAFFGCMLMPAVRDLLMLFIAIELVSAPGFLMAAFHKRDPRSNEAGLKFFIFGVLSSSVMLYGMSLIFGLTGSLNLFEIAARLGGPAGEQPLALAAIFFIVVGFAFKVSSVPFHFWAPDTYEGSPVPVAAFLSVASKTARFAGLLVLMFVGFIHQAEFWTPVFAALSIATMLLGNLVALKQTQMVRLLAYSSVAQAGYMLLPFALVGGTLQQNAAAFGSVVTYVLIYSVMNLGAFTIVVLMAREQPSSLISDFNGLIKRAPGVAVAMTLFMISLAGVPPSAGFWAKFSIFKTAIGFGGAGPWLAGIMVVMSVVSVGYYFKPVRAMILSDEGEWTHRIRVPFLLGAVVAVSAGVLLIFFVLPSLVLDLAPHATLLAP